MANRHLNRVLSPGYLDGLVEWTDDELRSRRAECHQLEEAASYLRRLTQVRLDIIGAELDSRRRGMASTGTVVERLTKVLAGVSEHTAVGVRGRLMSDNPRDDQESWAAGRVDAAAGGVGMEDVEALDDGALGSLTDSLVTLEHDVSAERKRLHEVYDAIQAELVQRYRTGRSTVDRLLS